MAHGMPAHLTGPRLGWIAAVAAAVTLALSGCGAGSNPATLDDAPLNAQSANVGALAVRGVIVVAPEVGGADAVLIATIINQGSAPDALTGVTFTTPDGDEPAALVPPSIPLQPNATTTIPQGNRPTVTADSGTLAIGSYVQATLQFAGAGSVRMTLLVVPPTGPYADYTASP